jgi:diguanylate cyclase (GGDEF)-like protein
VVNEDRLSAVLAEFARTVITDFPIQGILDHLVQRIVGVLPISAAGVTLISASEKPDYIAASDASALRFEQIQTELGEGPCLAAYQTGEAVAIADLAADDRFPRFAPAAVAAGLGAVFTFPLRDGDVSIGALDLYRTSSGPLDAHDMETAQTLADVTTAYLLNARAREQARATSNAFHHNSLHDPLTGLPNRQLLQDRLTKAAARSKRAHTQAAVLFVDLDRFKEVNDRHGHHVGDALLLAVTDRLNRLVRESDTLARVSGDEFVIFCEEVSSADDAELLAARIVQSMRAPFSALGIDLAISASVGIAFAGPGEKLDDQLVINADMAMYQVKRRGGAGHQVIDLRDRLAHVDDDTLEADLRRALAADELDVAYQPIVRPVDRSVVAVEALLRWTHPSLGPVEPRLMIAMAERSDLINDIDDWVLRRACRDRRHWLRQFPGAELDLTVNVSVRHLLQPAFATSVAEALAMFDTPPTALVLEVTENIFIDDNDRVRKVLDDLNRTGIRIALDDYGTGFSSLGYVAHLPVHILKIDRGFINDLASDAGQIIVASVNQLAHDLGLQVVAEGVETTDQHDAIAALRCDLAQGYLYARPMDAASVSDFIATHAPIPFKAVVPATMGNGDGAPALRGGVPRR